MGLFQKVKGAGVFHLEQSLCPRRLFEITGQSSATAHFRPSVGTGKTASESVEQEQGNDTAGVRVIPLLQCPLGQRNTKHIQSSTTGSSLAALLCNNFAYIEFQISWSILKVRMVPFYHLKTKEDLSELDLQADFLNEHVLWQQLCWDLNWGFFQSIFQRDDFLSTSFTAEYHKGSDNLLMMKVSTSLAAHKVSLSQSGFRLFKILAISLGNEAT